MEDEDDRIQVNGISLLEELDPGDGSVTVMKEMNSVVKEMDPLEESVPAVEEMDPVEQSAPVLVEEFDPLEERIQEVEEIHPLKERIQNVEEMDPLEERVPAVEEMDLVEQSVPVPVEEMDPLEERIWEVEEMAPLEERVLEVEEMNPVGERISAEENVSLGKILTVGGIIPVKEGILMEKEIGPAEERAAMEQRVMEEMVRMEEMVHTEEMVQEDNFDTSVMGMIGDDAYASRSASENFEAGSGNEQEEKAVERPAKKSKYHRHTQEQINELEALFKACPHPDEKQRSALGRKLDLEPRQVKFWFQNRRTQMKNQSDHHENIMLKEENDQLRIENIAIKDTARNPVCNQCGGPATIGDITMGENQLQLENAELRDELGRVCRLAEQFMGKSVSPLLSTLALPRPNARLELEAGRNDFGALSLGGTRLMMDMDVGSGISSTLSMGRLPGPAMMNPETTFDRSVFLELAVSAMDELIRLSEADSPLWITSLGGGKETLNLTEYTRTFSPCIGLKPSGFVTEASRETSTVIISSLALVDTLMDGNRWAQMFPCVIAKSSVTDVLSNGMGGTKHGALQLMRAEFQVLSPFVPVRQVKFLRFCQRQFEGIWAVVDVSVDTDVNGFGGYSFINCRRLPSGCVVQDLSNGISKVTWIEHSEYDESAVHYLYRSLLSSGMGFGALRWISTLQRQCESFTILTSPTIPSECPPALTPIGKRNLIKLTNRMRDNFCAGICPSTVRMWSRLHVASLDDDVKVMFRANINNPGEPNGIILSAATSVWIPVMHQQLFNLLQDEKQRNKWDILSRGGRVQQMVHIPKGQTNSNQISLLRPALTSPENTMLIVQETWTDESGSFIVYAPADVSSVRVVMTGGDPNRVSFLPSGFAIVPDASNGGGGPNDWSVNIARGAASSNHNNSSGPGSVLTVGFQILANNLPAANLSAHSVEAVASLLSSTIDKIKSAVHAVQQRLGNFAD